jgi:hypothetical protein
MQTLPFKVGHRVIAIDTIKGAECDDYNESNIGIEGTIIEVNGLTVTVQFDTAFKNGHTGYQTTGLDGHCWNYKIENLDDTRYFKLT